ALDAAFDEAEHVVDLLGPRLRLVGHIELDVRTVLTRRAKGDRAVHASAGDGVPGDDLVRLLLVDLRFPLGDVAGNLRLPREAPRIDLADLRDALHELGELLELGPLVVDHLQRRFDLDRAFYLRHHVLLILLVLRGTTAPYEGIPRAPHQNVRLARCSAVTADSAEETATDEELLGLRLAHDQPRRSVPGEV